ncbi:hypothetical protein [Sphingomonas oryzagri]
MRNASRLFRILSVLPAACFGITPAFAQGSLPVQHVRVYDQPVSSAYCVDTAAMDAGATGVAPLPSFQCKDQAEWANDGLIVSRI